MSKQPDSHVGETAVRDIPFVLPVPNEAAELARQILMVVDGLTWQEVCQAMGAALFALGVADAYQRGEMSTPDARAFSQSIGVQLLERGSGAIFCTPGQILIDLAAHPAWGAAEDPSTLDLLRRSVDCRTVPPRGLREGEE